MRAVNLLPREDTSRKASENSRNVVAIVAGAGGLLVVIVLVVAAAIASSHVKDARADLARARAELAKTPAHASTSLAQNRLLSARERRTLALASTLSRRVAWDRILRRLALVLPDDVWLTDLTGDTPTSPNDTSSTASTATASTPETTPTGLTLEGYSYSHAAVARLLARLGVVPDLKNVQLQTSTAEDLNGVRVVRFTIAADVRRGGDTK
jgi:Tfp pilus assembly protein PilN